MKETPITMAPAIKVDHNRITEISPTGSPLSDVSEIAKMVTPLTARASLARLKANITSAPTPLNIAVA